MKTKEFFKNLAFALMTAMAVVVVYQWFFVSFAAWIPVFTTVLTFLVGIALIALMGLGVLCALGYLITAVKALFIKEESNDE